MNYLRIAQSIALVATAAQLVACHSDRGYSMNDMLHHAELEKESTRFDYESELQNFRSDEKFTLSVIYGDQIPDAFKGINLREPSPFDLLIKTNEPRGITYVEFVDELKISCDGTVEVTDEGHKETISSKELFDQARWRPLRLSICGKIEVPDGAMLIIKVKESSKVENLELITNKNSHLSLEFGTLDYSGDEVKTTIADNSVFKLYFPYSTKK